MKYCPLCDMRYTNEAEVCALDGTVLTLSVEQKDPTADRIIMGRYRVLGKIGEGGMGTVYRAEQTSVGRKVALKLLHGSYANDEELISRFRREARRAASLNHRNIVKIYEFDQAEDGSLFIAMEQLEGRKLSEVIRRESPLELGRASALALQIVEGMDSAHRAGVLHRELKPDNIMIVRAGGVEEIKLLDFGLARLRDAGTTGQATRANFIMGNPAYMAPEQAEGGEVSEKTDIYALGIVLYELFCGTVPFQAATTGAVIIKQLQEPPAPLRRVRPDVPTAVERAIMQALEKKPDRRQRDMAEVQEQLRGAQDQPETATGSKSGTALDHNVAGRTFNKPAQAKPEYVASPAPEARTILLRDPAVEDSQEIPESIIPRTQILSREEIFTERSRRPIGKWIAAALALFGLVAGLGTVIYITTREPEQRAPVAPSLPAVVSLAVESNKNTLVPMERTLLNASARYADGKTQVLATGLDWRSSDSSVVSVTSDGQVEARKAGTAEIIARHNEVTSRPVIFVVKGEKPDSPGLTSLTLSAPKRELLVNERIALRARGRYADGKEKNLTDGVLWQSSDERVASVDYAGRVTAQNSGNVGIHANYDGLASPLIALTVKESKAPRPEKSEPGKRRPDTENIQKLATLYFNDGKYEEAVAELNRVIAIDPDNREARSFKSKVEKAWNAEKRLGR